jgi:hypothetical protein
MMRTRVPAGYNCLSEFSGNGERLCASTRPVKAAHMSMHAAKIFMTRVR